MFLIGEEYERSCETFYRFYLFIIVVATEEIEMDFILSYFFPIFFIATQIYFRSSRERMKQGIMIVAYRFHTTVFLYQLGS